MASACKNFSGQKIINNPIENIGKNQCHTRRHGSRPHDIPPVKDHKPMLAAPGRTGPAAVRRPMSGMARQYYSTNKADVPGPKDSDSLVSSAVKCANRHADIARQRTFPIGITRTPAPSSLGGFPTRVHRATARTVASGPASENLTELDALTRTSRSVRGDRGNPVPYRDELQLMGRGRKRHVVVMRRRRKPPNDVALPARSADDKQLFLGISEVIDSHDPIWEYGILETSLEGEWDNLTLA